jgi:hypothetical protein
MAKVINPAVGGNIENVVYSSTVPLTWNEGAGTGVVTLTYPVDNAVGTTAGSSEDQNVFTTESIDLTNFDTMIIDVTYQILATSSAADSNIGQIDISVDGNTVFSFDVEANFGSRTDRFELDISALSVNGIITIDVGANGRDAANGETRLILNEMKLINRAI